jgi:uncharacterized protein (DUF58 family)
VTCRAELRVYPNLLGERRAVASIFLRRALPGVHSARQIGKGRDFEKLRDYVPGDSFDDIHWKATAKRAHPVTKVFQIERTQETTPFSTRREALRAPRGRRPRRRPGH